MYRLLTFLYKQLNTIIFLGLALLSILIVVQFNSQQQHAFGDMVLEISGRFEQRRQTVREYFYLKQANEDLKAQNTYLSDQIDSLQKVVAAQSGILGLENCTFIDYDTLNLLSNEEFNIIACKAIKNTTHKNYNYITLDKGANQNIKEGMGLVSPQGIAGKIIRVSDNYSLALSVLNISFKLSAVSKRNNTVGLFEWDGKNIKYGNLNNIPVNIPLEKGDMIVSTGYGSTFPKGMKLGVIDKVNSDSQDGYHKATVKLATNFRRLSNLYIIGLTHNDTIKELEKDLPEQ